MKLKTSEQFWVPILALPLPELQVLWGDIHSLCGLSGELAEIWSTRCFSQCLTHSGPSAIFTEGLYGNSHSPGRQRDGVALGGVGISCRRWGFGQGWLL